MKVSVLGQLVPCSTPKAEIIIRNLYNPEHCNLLDFGNRHK